MILIACEESQAVCIEMRAIGLEAYSCDMQECSGGHPEWHIMGDVIPLLNGFCRFQTMDGVWHELDYRWEMIIAHPPCTFLTKAGACRLYKQAGKIDPVRMAEAVKARLFFQKFMDAQCEKICIENPTPMKVVQLPPPTQVIQPYEFGHPYSKWTCLWIKGLPPLKPTEKCDRYTPFMPSNTGGLARGKGGSRGKAHDPKTASVTFHGIAKAMADQWGGLLKEGKL